MSIKSLAAKIFANFIDKKTQKWASNPVITQQQVFEDLIRQAVNTQFGKDHNFRGITTLSVLSVLSVSIINKK